MSIVRYSFLFLLLLVFAAACGPTAFPTSRPGYKVRKAVEHSREAKFNAGIFADEATQERERSEKILQRATELVTRAEALKKECRQVLAKIEKEKRDRLRRIRAARRRRAAEAKRKKEEEAKKPKYPDYSPSDAPLDILRAPGGS